jgi:TusA-related sulfurtransferase
MATSRLDARGRSCPIPIVQLKRAIDGLATGDAVEILADDAAFPADVTAWCKKLGHELVSLATQKGAYTALVRKAGAP